MKKLSKLTLTNTQLDNLKGGIVDFDEFDSFASRGANKNKAANCNCYDNGNGEANKNKYTGCSCGIVSLMKIIIQNMKNTISALVVVFSSCILIYANGSQKIRDSTICDIDKIYTISKLWSEIKYNFVNIDKIDFDADSLYRVTLNEILAVKDDIEYFDILKKYLASFKDAHTNLIDTGINLEYNFDDIPINIIEHLGSLYITSICKGDIMDSTFLGGKIIKINDINTKDYVEKHYLPYCCYQTIPRQWSYAAKQIQTSRKGSVIKLDVEKVDNTISVVELSYNFSSKPSETMDFWSIEGVYKNRPKSAVSLEWAENDIAILAIRDFLDSSSDKIDEALSQVSSRASALILDLRDNVGGSTDVVLRVQMYLNKADTIRSFGYQTRVNNGYGKSQGNYREKYKGYFDEKEYQTYPPEIVLRASDIVALSCPIVILINRFSLSACEDLLINLHELPDRITLIGETTGGSTGAPLVVDLPNGVVARICTLRPTFPYSGKPFFSGIVPDISVEPSLKDIFNGYDVVKQKALNVLKYEQK